MSYKFDKTYLLAEARRKGYKAQEAALRAQGVPTKQHNVDVETKAPTKKASSQKSAKPAAKKAAKKVVTKKTAAAKKAASKK